MHYFIKSKGYPRKYSKVVVVLSGNDPQGPCAIFVGLRPPSLQPVPVLTLDHRLGSSNAVEKLRGLQYLLYSNYIVLA